MSEELRKRMLLALLVARSHSLVQAMWALRDVPGEEPSLFQITEARNIEQTAIINWLTALDRPMPQHPDHYEDAVQLARALLTEHIDELNELDDQIGAPTR